MLTRYKNFSIPIAALALAMMLSAGAVLAQTADSHGAAVSGSSDKASERQHDDLAGKLVRRVIQRAPSSIPGREIVQVETEIPVGVSPDGTFTPVKRSATSSPAMSR